MRKGQGFSVFPSYQAIKLTKPYFVTVGNRQKKPLNVRKCRDASNKNGANSLNKKQTVKLVKSVIYLSHEWTRLVLAETAAALILSS